MKDYNDFLSDNTDAKEYWEKEWQDMPEFVQENKEDRVSVNSTKSIHSVAVHFKTEQDMKDFSDLINRNVTIHTKAFYFKLREEVDNSKVYVDEP